MSYKHLEDELVKTGHYVGLKFSDGWFFVHVLETEYTELKPWVLYNENGERGEISPGEAGELRENKVTDTSEREYIVPSDNERNLFFQTFMGVSPSRIQVFPRFGRNNRPNLVGGAEAGGNQVPISGYDSPYNAPTRQGEIITVNNMPSLSLQPYNPTSEPLEARLSFHVNKFRWAAIDNPELQRAFIEGQANFRDHTVGLGARDNEQEDSPGWLQSRFSDVILTTEEILEFNGSSPRSAANRGDD